ncbi:hypothetical protein F4804DRAFT_308258 [Jackrogersella minutella]|nr:hypothetical protein F4804DRAFT_308258 [Jackrogersella minutella]
MSKASCMAFSIPSFHFAGFHSLASIFCFFSSFPFFLFLASVHTLELPSALASVNSGCPHFPSTQSPHELAFHGHIDKVPCRT